MEGCWDVHISKKEEWGLLGCTYPREEGNGGVLGSTYKRAEGC